jgi:hypothetical protein
MTLHAKTKLRRSCTSARVTAVDGSKERVVVDVLGATNIAKKNSPWFSANPYVEIEVVGCELENSKVRR